jgi:hypothetical protein
MKHGIIIAVLTIVFNYISASSYCQVINSDKKIIKFEYKPEEYELNKIDTTINDSIRLIVKHYTLMDSFANDYGDVTPDSIVYGYRDYALEIELFNHGKEVINRKILKSDFVSDEKYWKNLTMFKVGLESIDPKVTQIILKVGLGLPGLYKPVIATLIIGYDGEIITKLK